jgi:hypothetical protein
LLRIRWEMKGRNFSQQPVLAIVKLGDSSQSKSFVTKTRL